jgi:hypothetical protein
MAGVDADTMQWGVRSCDGSFENPGGLSHIETVTISNGDTDLEFANIPQTYNHLKMFIYCRSDDPGANSSGALTFNGAGTDSYWYHIEYKDAGSTGGVGSSTDAAFIHYGFPPGSTFSTDAFMDMEINILGYASTSYKVLSGMGSLINGAAAGNLYRIMTNGGWNQKEPITQINLKLVGSTDAFEAGVVSLYGMR